MKLLSLACIVCTLLLFSCKENTNGTFSKYLNQDALPLQTFELDVNRDTMLITKENCVIRIPAGSLESDQSRVKLEVKEAISNKQIVLAGLTTTSDGKALSSGGMLKIEAAKGYNVKIKKPLNALIPTKNYNADMSVYKGVEKDGKINWTDPQPLENDSLQMMINGGKKLFVANCASCHKTDQDFTGPALKGITQRMPLSWIYRFTKNPAGMIATDSYSQQVAAKWKPTVMTAFPALDNRSIYAILAYIETKGGMKSADFVNSTKSQLPCADSCERYLSALNANQLLQNEISETNEDFFDLRMNIPVLPAPDTNRYRSYDEIIPVEKAQPVKAIFYTVKIETFGWLNVDIMAKQNNTSPSELKVKVEGKYETDVQVMLIIPSVKLFVAGTRTGEKQEYVFYGDDGGIPLPQNVPCYIIAFAESDGKLVFGKKYFVSSLSQSISISMSETTKEGMADQIDALKLDGIETNISDSKQVKQKLLDKNMIEAEKLKPVDCDCSLPEKFPADSARPVYANILSKGNYLFEAEGSSDFIIDTPHTH